MSQVTITLDKQELDAVLKALNQYVNWAKRCAAAHRLGTEQRRSFDDKATISLQLLQQIDDMAFDSSLDESSRLAQATRDAELVVAHLRGNEEAHVKATASLDAARAAEAVYWAAR